VQAGCAVKWVCLGTRRPRSGCIRSHPRSRGEKLTLLEDLDDAIDEIFEAIGQVGKRRTSFLKEKQKTFINFL